MGIPNGLTENSSATGLSLHRGRRCTIHFLQSAPNVSAPVVYLVLWPICTIEMPLIAVGEAFLSQIMLYGGVKVDMHAY